nr:reverse transcriptase domain-containing protein [Tanacetum cinerariifolium]
SRVDPTLLNDFEIAAEGNGHPPVPDLRTMEELCQPSLNCRGGPIAPIAIQAMNFGLKNDMIQQVYNSCQFHGLSGDDANKHLDKFLHVTQSIKVNQQMKAVTLAVKLMVVLIPTMIVQPSLAKPKTYMLWKSIKANDANLKNMQTNMTSLTNSNIKLKNMFGQFMKMNTASSSGSKTLPGNTVTNPKEDLKGITTRSGTAYQGPTIPTTSSSLPKVVERETETETSMPNSEPVVAPVSASNPNQKPLIPYPSRLHDQKLRDKANDQKEKFFQIYQDLNFNISFAYALILMPKFGPTIKTLLTNKDKLSELARSLLNEHCSKVLLKKFPEKLEDPDKFLIPCDFPGMAECLALADLGASINLMPLSVWNKLYLPELSPMCMTLELTDHSISLVDFDADPQVPLILGRSFHKTGRAFIDVFKGELTLRVSKEAITFNLDQTLRYSANYNDMTENRIDVIDMACKEYSQEVLGFSDVIDLPPHLEYAFLEGNNKLPIIIANDLSDEEKTALITVLKSRKRAIACKLSDIKGINPEFCTYKILMEDDFEPAVQLQRRVNPKIYDVIKRRNSFQTCLSHLEKMLKWFEDTNLYLNWEKSHIMVKEGIVLDHKISKNGIEVEKAKVEVISKLPHPTIVKGIRSIFGHVGFYRQFIQDFSKIARPMTRLLKNDTLFFFSKECVEAFQTLKRKLTEAPILIAPYWDLPFELICDAIDFYIGAVLGQRQEKYFRPIQYASKTMTKAESNYTTTEKEMLAVMYAFKKFQSYLIMNKSIMYTDHSALKYIFAKKDSKSR